jgi:hypothetical protein
MYAGYVSMMPTRLPAGARHDLRRALVLVTASAAAAAAGAGKPGPGPGSFPAGAGNWTPTVGVWNGSDSLPALPQASRANLPHSLMLGNGYMGVQLATARADPSIGYRDAPRAI